MTANPLSGHFLFPLTLFCLGSLLHKKKLHKQSQPQPHSHLMKQTCSLGFLGSGPILGIYCFNSCGDCILAAVVGLLFRQVPHPLQTQRITLSARGCEGSVGSSPRPAENIRKCFR